MARSAASGDQAWREVAAKALGNRSFVIGVASDRDSAAICRAVIGMGRSLGLLLVAEGVENDADLSFVREQGFDFAQGYHYAAAMPAWELRDWLLRRWVS